MSAADLNTLLVAAAAIVLLGVSAVRLSTRAGLPSLLLYLAIGVAIGESGLGIRFDDVQLTQVLSTVALAVILAEGGLTTNLSVVRPVLSVSLVLATIGVGISVAVTSWIAWLILDVDLRTALLLGAVVSSTDAAAVFAVMRALPMRARTRATLEAESGFNDPPVIILVTLVVSDAWETMTVGTALTGFAVQMVIGVVVGAAAALLGSLLLRRIALPAAGLYPLALFAFAFLGFGVAGMVGGSPFVAAYVAGLILGNSNLPHRVATVGFAEGLAWLAQIGLFVLLGLLASPARLGEAVLPALVVGTALTFVARPVSVWLCTTPFRVPWREQAFISWAGLRGAVPIMLATLPMSAGVAGAQTIFDVVFLLVVVFTLIQGPTLPWLSRRLGISDEVGARELAFEHAPFEDIGTTMLTVDVPPGSRLSGVEIRELRLPDDALVALVLRAGQLFVPHRETRLRTGDQLILVTAERDRARTEGRLREVSRGGRLAEWHAPRSRPGAGPRPGAAAHGVAGSRTVGSDDELSALGPERDVGAVV
ncbi:potassium/proton antiporter [Intrasporangium sp.]|uniref:potassium/proton antiporter n=1 Tax=Intrasporangium sp. TaxID=1925024 RepID=UPI00293A1653|nr:potassium/proton antiporter [Intrasporangium sp.]MDV3221843.1 potassium/proton antiporter [Intrasporangium sp.]